MEHSVIRFSLKKKLHGAQGDLLLELEFEMEEEEFIVVLGPSGSGKTTLLRMLAGLEKPEEGYIEVKGEVWYDSKRGINLPPQKRDVGFVFQDYALFPNMSLFENIAFGMKKKDLQRVMELLRLAGLEQLKDKKPSVLSGGQKQRVALLRALAREPKLLLLDEPLSALDPETAIILREEIKKFQRSFNIPTIMVSHNREDALSLASRVLLLSEGKIKSVGKPKDVLFSRRESPKFSLNGIVLEKEIAEYACILSVAVGSEVVQVVVPKDQEKEFKPGDRVLLSTKAFVPIVRKA
ncbi:ABC transporter ATP-binding protein [Thermocrinis ruber]|uniref:ABC transporter ATP-binding protein n=1 Tax=Thermocrinis ruber TaxID=75906 RepID=UPI001FE1EB80|nr:ABC transporter ATP-binding protein [Thermocrinis ruber]